MIRKNKAFLCLAALILFGCKQKESDSQITLDSGSTTKTIDSASGGDQAELHDYLMSKMTAFAAARKETRSIAPYSVNSIDSRCIQGIYSEYINVVDAANNAIEPLTKVDSNSVWVHSEGTCSNETDGPRNIVLFRDSVVGDVDDECYVHVFSFKSSTFPYGTKASMPLSEVISRLPQQDLITFSSPDSNMTHSKAISTKFGTAYFDNSGILMGWGETKADVCK